MADQKITDLTAIDALATGDLFAVVDDPAGTPASKKATINQVQDYIEAAANVFTTAQTFQPATDVAAVTARRSAADATANILQLQDQANNLLTAFDKDGKLKFNGSSSGTVTIQPAAAAGTYTLTLPTSDGDAGQFLKTDGSGVLSWDAAGGGTPGGSDTQVQFNDGGSFGGDAGLTFNKTSKALTLGGGTVTTSSPVIDAAQTWNAGGVTFTGLKFNATDTASAAASLLMDLQVGGSSKFNVTKTANASIGGGSTNAVFALGTNNNYRMEISSGGFSGILFSVNSSITGASAGIFSNGFAQPADGRIMWSTTNGRADASTDTFLTRRAAANLRLGAADAAAPVAQTLSVQSVVAGTTNTAGANLTITGSQSTGSANGGSIIFQTAAAGSSGTAQNALATALTITSAKEMKCAGPLWVSNAYAAGAPSATGYIVLYDSTGTAYKIPAEAV
jgi:hypothetical protein